MRNKKGISLITLAVTMVVMIILTSIVILSLNNTGLIKDSKEAKYKSDLKTFDEEIREKIATTYLDDKTAMYRIITDPEEISKYSEDLVKSEYIEYAYISGGELTLIGDKLTDEQRKWAQEASIKIDDESVTFTEEKVMISLSEEDYTYGPITAILSFSNVPDGYELQYKIGDGKWTSKDTITDITRNGTIYARLYNKENYNEIGLNTKDITKIDRIAPTITQVVEPDLWAKDSVNVIVSGAKDNESGLDKEAYSFDDGATWQAANYKSFTSNVSGIIIKVRDAVGNIYTHDAININKIDTTAPTIESVTGNATEYLKGSVILKVNGAKDNESGLNETAYSFDNGSTWQKSNGKEFINNTSNIIIKVRDAVGNIYTHTAMNIIKIDNEGPEVPIGITVTPYLNKLVVQGKGSTDSGSGLAGYKYSLDNSTWTDMIPEAQTYEYTGIKSSTSKTIYVKAVDKLGNESKVYGPVNASTLAITDKVAINLSTDKPTQGPISADLSYSNVPSGYEVQYKLEEQTDYTAGIKITGINENTVITARLYNKTLQDEVALNTKPVTNIDREEPTMSNVSGNPSDWVNTDVTLTINGAADNSGMLADKPYSFDGGATWQAENTKTYTENKSDIVIKVKDYAGNIYTYPTINVSYIDKTVPTITNVTGNPTDWVSTDVTLTINGVDDNASGLHKTQTYSFDGGNTWQVVNTKTYTTNTSNIVIKVKDAAGNIYTHETINITKIDKEAPSKPTGIAVTSGLNTLTVKASGSTDAGIGVDGYKYSLDNITWTDLIPEGNTYTFDSIKSDTTVTIYAKAVDKLGLESSVYGPVDGTTSAVTNKVSITLSEEEWTRGPITADLSYTDIPTGYVIQYKIGTGSWTTGTKTTDISSNTTVYGRLYNSTLDGEIATNSKDVTNIDGKEPTITSVSGNPTTWTKNDVTLTVNGASDTSSGLHATETYSFDGGSTWQTANTKTYTANTSNIVIKVKDAVGNVYTHEAINITYIDKNAPTITSVSGNPTTWTKDDVTLTINDAADSASGLHATEPYSFDNGTTWQTSNTKTYTANTSNIIIKVKDKVGNIYTHSAINITYIDKSAPKVVFGTNGNSSASKTASTTVTVTDDGSLNTSSLKYLWTTIGSGITASSFTGSKSGTFTSGQSLSIPSNSSGEYYLYIYCEDSAGNSYIAKSNKFTVGNISPDATITQDIDSSTYTKGSVTLTIKPYSPTVLYDNGYLLTTNRNWYGPALSTMEYGGKILNVSAKVHTIETANSGTTTGIGAVYKYNSDGTSKDKYDVKYMPTGELISDWTDICNQIVLDENYTSNLKPFIIIGITSGTAGYKVEYKDIQYELYDPEKVKSVTVNGTNVTIADGVGTYEVTQNGTYNIVVTDIYGNTKTINKTVSNIDKEAPSKPTAVAITPNLNSLTVKASGSTDAGSGLAGYKYSLDNSNWSDLIDDGDTYTFDSIKSNTTQQIYVKAVDKLGWESSAYGPVDGTTSTVTNKVSITLSEEGWTKGPITATLSYDNVPSGYVIQYKIGTGSWTSGTKTTNISSNTTVYGRLYNSTLEDEIATNSKSVTYIDNDPPTDPTGLEIVTRNQTSIVVKASGSTDSGSGLAGYQYSINGTSWSETIASGTNYTISSLLDNSEYMVYTRAIDALGNISENNYTKEATTLSTYSVMYNSNTTETVGNMPTTQTKVEGITLTLSTSVPTRTGYRFNGWSTSTTGSVEYAAGVDYTADSALALYAVWEMAYYQNTTTSKLYVTLNEAITDSATGTQINVIRNATENVIATNTSGKTLTLNLNGKTILFNDGYNLVNAGTLTLKGSGKITANTGYTIQNTGTLTVNLDNETSYNDGTGGIIETTGAENQDRALEVSSGNLTINSGIIISSPTAEKVSSSSSTYRYALVTHGTATINGGIIRSISSDIETQYGMYTSGTLTMTGGTVESVGRSLWTNGSGNTTITGGKFINGGTNNTTGKVSICHASTGTLQISGTNTVEIYNKLNYGIYNQSTGSVVLSNPNLSVTALLRAINNASTGQITINSGTAKITSTTSSGNCVVNAAGGKIIINGGTIQASTNSTIYNAAAGTIEVNGGTISSASGMTNNGSGTIKITGGTITGTSAQGILNNGAGTINISGGSVIGYNHGLNGNTNSTGTVSITGGSVTGQNMKVIHGNWGTVTLGTNDSTVSTTSPAITGKTYGINMTAGTLNFYDGVVKGATAITNTVTGLPTNYGVKTTTANSVQTATLAKQYYVKYNANGGSGTMSNSTHLYGVSQALTANAFTRTGYTFKGWSTSSTATTATYTNGQSVSNLTTTVGGTVNLYAVWQAKTVEVTFMRNTTTSDTTSTKQTFTYGVTGQSFSAKGWTKTGYTLLGWNEDKTATAKVYNVTSGVNDGWINNNSPSTTLYGIWSPITYTVAYNANGGSGTMSSVTHTYDTAKNLTANTYTRNGYTFKGWATSAGGAVVYSDKASVKNLRTTSGTYTLYAVWEQQLPDDLYYTYEVSGTASFTVNSQSYLQITTGTMGSSTASAATVTIYDVPSGTKITGYTNGSGGGPNGSVTYTPAATVYLNDTSIGSLQSTSSVTTTSAGTVKIVFSYSGTGSTSVSVGGVILIQSLTNGSKTFNLVQK